MTDKPYIAKHYWMDLPCLAYTYSQHSRNLLPTCQLHCMVFFFKSRGGEQILSLMHVNSLNDKQTQGA